jgi:16S rRNA (cytidine1402-2'-O)-methyltransferase
MCRGAAAPVAAERAKVLKSVGERAVKGYLLNGVEMSPPALDAGLYVAATPIGNLADVTIRALETLAAADFIACEDTRVTSRLTKRYGIVTPLVVYREHNAERQRPRLLAEIANGKAVALVSDAGTPLVSDPGYRLVTEALAAGHKVVPIPGPSALLAGLMGAGLATDTFLFAGFLPPRSAARRTRLGELAAVPATLIFYEAPQRVAATLKDMADVLGGDRPAAVARELTKIFETFRHDRLKALAAEFADAPTPKGEVTILVGPPGAGTIDEAAIDAMLRQRLGQLSPSRAVAEVAAATGAPRSVVYARALALKAGDDADGT